MKTLLIAAPLWLIMAVHIALFSEAMQAKRGYLGNDLISLCSSYLGVEDTR